MQRHYPFAPRHHLHGITAVVLLVVAITGCSDSAESPSSTRGGRTRAVPVVTTPVVRESLRDELTAVGTARAVQSVTLFPESAGVVTAVSFNPDQEVMAGDRLLALDDREETLALRLAEVQRDDAALVVRRFASMNLSEANIPESELDTARAALAAAEIAVEQAALALARRSIHAPFTGRVGITDIDVGDRIDTTTQVTTLDDRRVLLVDFPVPEAFVGQVAPGTAVEINLWESTSAAISGEVVGTDSRIDPASRAYVARAAVDNATDTLRPGMAFEVRVPIDRGDYLAVPDVAVQWGADGAYIWVADDGVARRANVQLIRRLTDKLLIEADIPEGTPVIAEGVQAVRDGLMLRVLDPDALDRDARFELATPALGGDAGGAAGG